MRRSFLVAVLVGFALTGQPVVAIALPAEDPATIVAERAHARAELERLNLEIDALKQSRRGLGDDYQLRRKMADAEAVARRLTELDSRLSRTGGGAGAGARVAATPSTLVVPVPRPELSDDREVLEAKADILADEAHRLHEQVSLLEQRVGDLRGRQELRRRAGELERDPFSPLEQAKRRLPLGTATALKESAGGAGDTRQVAEHGPNTTIPVVPPPSGGAATATAAAAGPSGSPSLAPGSAPGSPASGNGVTGPAAAGAPSGTTTTFAPAPVPVSGSGGGESTVSLATQFRDILDPSTLAEIRKLESSGIAGARLPATEKALQALRARAEKFQSDADAIRRSARAPR